MYSSFAKSFFGTGLWGGEDTRANYGLRGGAFEGLVNLRWGKMSKFRAKGKIFWEKMI